MRDEDFGLKLCATPEYEGEMCYYVSYLPEYDPAEPEGLDWVAHAGGSDDKSSGRGVLRLVRYLARKGYDLENIRDLSSKVFFGFEPEFVRYSAGPSRRFSAAVGEYTYGSLNEGSEGPDVPGYVKDLPPHTISEFTDEPRFGGEVGRGSQVFSAGRRHRLRPSLQRAEGKLSELKSGLIDEDEFSFGDWGDLPPWREG